MKIITILDITAITLLAIHFGIPLAYYYYAKTRWLPKPWNLKLNSDSQPIITIIIPTYNEAHLIQEKLDNIHIQEYPRDKLEIIIIDSASTDGTIQKIMEWIREHPNEPVKIMQEEKRQGKAHALNKALKRSTGEIVLITDVDSFWLDKSTLKEVVKWLSDPMVGAVSCLKQPSNPGKAGIESGYRTYYNTLRLAESKAWSTPIFHGELAAYKKHLLQEIGGFPLDIGADDSHTATLIALKGYRAITPETIWCKELIPRRSYHSWRIRRAQHLIQHFIKLISRKDKFLKSFKYIVLFESFMHITNPLLLTISIFIIILQILLHNMMFGVILGGGVLLLISSPFRTWMTTQLYLTVGLFKNFRSNEVVWSKHSKHLDTHINLRNTYKKFKR